MKDTTKRFSDRVENYKKFRPSYPAEMVEYIRKDFFADPEITASDIGSGTGKMTELILPFCKTVYAVEPNPEMRAEADKKLSVYANYVSVNGTAENTTLKSASVDCITVAQAVHWFNLELSKIEFKRILRNNGPVIIIANKRVFTTDFLKEYERLIREGIPEYSEVNHYRITENVMNTFYEKNYKQDVFPNTQVFDWESLVGRFRSSSYTPKEDTSDYAELENKLRKIFDKYNVNGTVEFEYEAIVQSGQIG